MGNKVSREQAEIELKSWFDKKKTFEETQEKYKDFGEIIIEAIMNGVLVLDASTFEFTHQLLFPIGEDAAITSLKYKARINDKQVSGHLRGIKSDDSDGRLTALLAALTNQNRSVIQQLDSADKRISQAIGIFFI